MWHAASLQFEILKLRLCRIIPHSSFLIPNFLAKLELFVNLLEKCRFAPKRLTQMVGCKHFEVGAVFA